MTHSYVWHDWQSPMSHTTPTCSHESCESFARASQALMSHVTPKCIHEWYMNESWMFTRVVLSHSHVNVSHSCLAWHIDVYTNDIWMSPRSSPVNITCEHLWTSRTYIHILWAHTHKQTQVFYTQMFTRVLSDSQVHVSQTPRSSHESCLSYTRVCQLESCQSFTRACQSLMSHITLHMTPRYSHESSSFPLFDR